MGTPTREEIIALCATAPEQVADLVLALFARMQAFGDKVQELERRLGLNSSNSGKPPSSDGYRKPAPKSLRTKSGRPPGGQPGHPGQRLEFRADPDHVVVHRPRACRGCGHQLGEEILGQATDRRQVFELLARVEVTEHQVHAVGCPCCGEVTPGQFPADVPAPTQYGLGLKAFVAYCDTYQLLPTDRICELIYDLTGHRLSEGTLYNLNTTLYNALAPFSERTRELLIAEPVVHFDETGVRVQGKLYWGHVASTALLTFYAVHEKRGELAMNDAGILPAFAGVAIHDSWASYWIFACAHGLCNVHHQRELRAVLELDLQIWAGAMRALLYAGEQAVGAALAAGQDHLPAEQLAAITIRYDDLIAQGLAANPLPDPPPEPRRGRLKKTKARNLVERLQARAEAVLRFLHDFRVPFSNNQGERDMRMVKTQQKISGTFRSKTAAEEFFRIRGYISTVKKQGLPVLHCLRQALQGHPFLPAAASPAPAPGAAPPALPPSTPPAPPPAADLVPRGPVPTRALPLLPAVCPGLAPALAPLPGATPPLAALLPLPALAAITALPPPPAADLVPLGPAPARALPLLPAVRPALAPALAPVPGATPALAALLPLPALAATTAPPAPPAHDLVPRGPAPAPALPLPTVLPPPVPGTPGSPSSHLVARYPAPATRRRQQQPAEPRAHGHPLVPLGASP